MRRTDLALGWKSIPGYRHQLEGRDNEDAVFVSEEHPLFDAVLIVADGMGGHQEPKQAADTAAGTARDLLLAQTRWPASAADPRRLLHEVLQQANSAVLRLAPLGSPGRPPGTTLTVAVVWNGRLFVRHAGDGTTFLMREGRLQALVGGEERRAGNRPQSFLGMAPRIETEESVVELRAGDRILVCTDGLTRYFGAVGVGQAVGSVAQTSGEAAPVLADVLGRPNADPQTIANQLTAHSRGDRYDDDTTVVVAEVADVYEVVDPVPAVEDRRPTTDDRRPDHAARGAPDDRRPTFFTSRPFWVVPLATAVLGAVVGLGLGRWVWPASDRPGARSPGRSAASSLPVSPTANAPREAILLLDGEGKRVFALRPGSSRALPRQGTLKLQGARMLPSGELTSAGTWQLDLRRSRLTGPKGQSSYVDIDDERGVLTVRRPGMLRVKSGGEVATVILDGVTIGKTPLGREVPAGKHRLRLEWSDGRAEEQEVQVPVRGGLSLEWGP